MTRLTEMIAIANLSVSRVNQSCIWAGKVCMGIATSRWCAEDKSRGFYGCGTLTDHTPTVQHHASRSVYFAGKPEQLLS